MQRVSFSRHARPALHHVQMPVRGKRAVLDGNIPHGITTLRDCPGQGGTSRPELERFSVIVFSTFAREDIKAPGNYSGMWADWMMPKVVWKSK